MLLLLLSLDHHQYQYVSSHLFILRDRRSRMALFSVGIVLLFGNSTYGRGPKTQRFILKISWFNSCNQIWSKKWVIFIATYKSGPRQVGSILIFVRL